MNKGFTLIELLAVIVILAIIALIATPIVLSIINNTQESAVIRSGEFYVDAVKNKIMQENMKQGGTLNPSECIVGTDGNVTCDGTLLPIEVNGQKPTRGSITFVKGKVTNINLTFGDKTVSMDSNGQLVLGDNIPICNLISDSDSSGSITAGDKYQCKVKDNMETGFEDGYYFFVLSSEEDGTTNLIMDRNINSDGTPTTKAIYEDDKDSNGGIYNCVAYNIDSDAEDAGPVTAMQFLNNATEGWSNISNLDITYNDEGKNFDNFKVTGKARLPYYSEVSDYDETNGYLYDHLHVACYNNSDDYNPVACEEAGYIDGVYEKGVENITDIHGYWTFSTSADNFDIAWDVGYDGYMSTNDAFYYDYLGVRPVINVKL